MIGGKVTVEGLPSEGLATVVMRLVGDARDIVDVSRVVDIGGSVTTVGLPFSGSEMVTIRLADNAPDADMATEAFAIVSSFGPRS